MIKKAKSTAVRLKKQHKRGIHKIEYRRYMHRLYENEDIKKEEGIKRKKISEMTAADKIAFLEATKTATEKEQGVPWKDMEAKILDDMDQTFDDEKFAKMDPVFRIDAAYARKEFGDKKPELVDYILWMEKFVTHSDYVEWR